MTPSEGSTISTETVSRYLDDVARMLADADPAYRAEVLAGVHDHLEAALGPAPWRESEVRQVLDQLGPPEEIAAAALEESGQPHGEAGPVFMARSWVPPVVVTIMAIALFGHLFMLSRFYVFTPFLPGSDGEAFVSIPEPLSFLWSLPILLLVPPTPLVLLGALLVTISPLYRRVDRVAAWLVLPWCAVVFELGAVVIRATDDCARAVTGSCTGVDPATGRAALGAALVIAGIGVLLLLVRLGRVRAMAPRATVRWWTATAVALGLLISALPVIFLPLTYREGTYVSLSADGLIAYPWTFADTLAPVLTILPVWILTIVLLVRSPLWRRAAKVIGVALLPVLLAAAAAVTAVPSALSPQVLSAGTVVTIAGTVATALAAALLFVSAQRAASQGATRT